MLNDLLNGLRSITRKLEERYRLAAGLVAFGASIGGMVGAVFTYIVLRDNDKEDIDKL